MIDLQIFQTMMNRPHLSIVGVAIQAGKGAVHYDTAGEPTHPVLNEAFHHGCRIARADAFYDRSTNLY